jgi:hypothetical protein
MANMAYCRFTNTLTDLRDCEKHLVDDDLDLDEQKARAQLVRVCRRIIDLAPEPAVGKPVVRT